MYFKNSEKLDMELFKSPTSQYRGVPFWSWNCKLEKNELLRQIECLRQMGFGGFNMHARSGLDTEYLGDEFMELVADCAKYAQERNMLAWLYDEDRYPSGAAGGYVTKKIENRQKYILFTTTDCKSVSKEEYLKTGIPHLVACFDIVLGEDKTLKSYKIIDRDDTPQGVKWYVFECMSDKSGWYNNQTYVDMMDENAICDFIDTTHEKYKKVVGDKFGNTVPAIFTDEPQIKIKGQKKFSDDLSDVILPWTYDFADTFSECHGYDITERLPEIIWELPDHKPSAARYHYHDHVCERFARAFSDQCGEWCKRNSLYFSGHVMAEENLHSQTSALGEAMRLYRSFTIPGIDILCDNVELATAKQAQSVAHQYGREGVLSELYGVTGWDFDFRGHKFQGDWQAALGVTVRAPHLSWVTMKGCAKRDYPASINYQSPWYKEYPYIEDHFARLNTILTKGKPMVKVGVIHPIESFWLSFGPRDLTAAVCDEMEENFNALINRLLFGMVDFDFISESLMLSLYEKTDNASLKLGKMNYDAVIVPNLRTIRRSTLDILNQFRENGGKVIFIGNCPDCVDALACGDAKELFEKSVSVPTASPSLLEELKEERFVSVYGESGKMTDNLIHTLRDDNGEKYLFLARAKKDINPDIIKPQRIKIVINGMYTPVMLDTLSGDIKEIEYKTTYGETVIYYTLYNSDSLLIKLTQTEAHSSFKRNEEKPHVTNVIDFKDIVEFERDEPNVAVLDIAEYSLDGKMYEPKEEILRIDKKIREKYNFPLANGEDIQPWAMEKEEITNFPYLRFTFESEFEAECMLCFEELSETVLNGEEVRIEKQGWYTDKQLFTMRLPKLKNGMNELIVRVPIGKSVSIENFLLLGDFDVHVCGCNITIKEPRRKIAFGSIVNQGMPFYGGNITYKTKINLQSESDIRLRVNHYRGALVRVSVDGKDFGELAFAPYEKEIKNLSAGEHTIEFKLFGTRVNTFSALHNCNRSEKWKGPSFWYSENDAWSYEYCLNETGILSSPVIEVIGK
ncbi:MAG: hypothetical protein J1F01_09795 [Oscillospiraceae bacterium]|nr:hypothetical protein [Oscillospiraceae bacterium]